MRISPVLTLTLGAVLLAACSGDSNGPSNGAPTAAFTYTCSDLACSFTDGSTDADGTVASRSWDFGDQSAAVTTANADHSFGTPNTYTVTLTVTDNGGATNATTKQVTVPNVPPTANYSSACTDLDCKFTDLSSDSDIGGSIASWSWNFGDQTAATSQNPQHSFGQAGTYTVALTVTDNGGATGTVSKQVVVTAAQAGGPSAKFANACSSLDCTFTDQSTPSGTIVSWVWDFGDGSPTSALQNPVHSYNVQTLTSYTVTLTVTGAGSLTSTASKQITVAPAATLTCNGADCTLGLDQASTVLVTLVSTSCVAHGNKFVVTAPVTDTLFTDGCYATPGTSFPLNNGAVFAQGTQLQAEVLSGISGTIGLVTDPALRVSGNFTDGWTLEFDDGAGGPGEPDYNDLVILVKATPQ